MFARVLALGVVVLALSFCPHIVLAQQAGEASSRAVCEKLPWPVERERVWFGDEELVRRRSGARLRKIDRAVELSLEPSDRIDLFLPPEVGLKPHTYSGEATFFGVPKRGLYQVTLSDEATVDVFENGVRLRATASASAKNCHGVFESLRYELAPGDLVLVEITNASSNSIKVAFAQAVTER